MDRAAVEMLKRAEEPASAEADHRLRDRVVKVGLSAVPWLVIAGLLLAGLFVKPTAVGQTVQPPVIERRDHFFGLTSPMEGVIWVAGSDGKIVAVGPDGRAARLPTPAAWTLQDVAAWDAQRAVAVGNDGVVLTSNDRGAHWLESKAVPRSAVANKLTRVRLLRDGRGWAVGEMGALLETADFGATWERRFPEQDVAWNDVAFADDSNGWVVGEFGRMLKTADGGKTWTAVDGPVKSSLMGIAFHDSSRGVAVGLEGVVLVTNDGGLAWRRVPVDSREHLFDVAWDTVGHRWIACGNLGVVVTGSEDSSKWIAARLDAHDLAWHTRVLPTREGVWLTGANLGMWREGRWVPYGG
jgi:photosystem II stability/assembly factor-like uncharacterized protein